MPTYAVYISTFRSVVDTSKNTTDKECIAVITIPGMQSKSAFEISTNRIRKDHNLQPNQTCRFVPIRPFIHSVIEDGENWKSICGRIYRYHWVMKYSKFVNCKKCLAKLRKAAAKDAERKIV